MAVKLPLNKQLSGTEDDWFTPFATELLQVWQFLSLEQGAATSDFVLLQSSSPGTAQTGNLNVSGNAIVGAISVDTAATPTEKIDMSTTGDVAILDGLKGPTRCVSTSSSTAISNTAATTAFSKTFSIPANYLRAGSVVRVHAGGIYSTTGTPTIFFQARVGSQRFFQSSIITTAANASNYAWNLSAMDVFRTIGAAATHAPGPGFVNMATGSVVSTTVAINDGNANTANTNVNSTGALTVDITVTWGTASLSNTITMATFVVEIDHGYTTV